MLIYCTAVVFPSPLVRVGRLTRYLYPPIRVIYLSIVPSPTFSNALISLFIPCCNGELFLREAIGATDLRSLLGHLYKIGLLPVGFSLREAGLREPQGD